MMNRLIIILFLVVFTLGCIKPGECEAPYILYEGECCLDEDANGLCDEQELERMVFVVKEPDPSCGDGIMNQNETGVDCGGPCEPCPPEESCFDGIMNQNETGVDCGGPCEPCYSGESCFDGIMNQNETGVDCGGPCEPCFCSESTLALSDTRQDGYVGDVSDPPDGAGDKVSNGGYLMVGDLTDRAANQTIDDVYRAVIAFPLSGLRGDVSDARLFVHPYMTQGTALDTFIEHIQCSGILSEEDYGSQALDLMGVLVKASDPNDLKYSVDVTRFLKQDLNASRGFSCFRLYLNQTALEGLNNNKADRRIFYGYGSPEAPYITFTQRPCVLCNQNSDCGNTSYTSNFLCRNKEIIRQYVHYRCSRPGTEYASCVATQEVEDVDSCKSDEDCVDGDDKCFPEECFDGEEGEREEDVDCGGQCRPCHCFDARMNYGEEGVDCGGLCRPCPPDERVLTLKIVSPSNKGSYDSRQVFLKYSVNKEGAECSFSLNGGANISLTGNRDVTVARGANNIVVYCTHDSSEFVSSQVNFSSNPSQSMVCPADPAGSDYSAYFDEVLFFTDNISQIGSTYECRAGAFTYATTRNDSAVHEWEPFDKTQAMSETLLGDYEDARLAYSCVGDVRHEAGFLHALKRLNPANLSDLHVIIYFHEITGAASQNSFFRAYAYNNDADSVKTEGFLDVPYAPLSSACDAVFPVKYQELDLSPLLTRLSDAGAGEIQFRLAFYSRNTEAVIGLMEMELSAS